MPYMNPGYAASQGMNEFLVQREAAKLQRDQLDRQRQQDALAQAREDRITRLAQNEDQRQQLELEHKMAQDKTTEAHKIGQSLLPGDIPDADTAKLLDSAGVGGMYLKQPAQSLPGIRMVPPSQTQVGITPTLGQREAVGSPAERDKLAQETKQKELGNTIKTAKTRPEAVSIAISSGVVPPGSIDDVVNTYFGKDAIPVFRQNAKVGTVERLLNGKWEPWTGDVPQGSHFMTEPQPNPAADNAASNRMDKSYTLNIGQLDKLTQPLEQQSERLSKLETSVRARTPQADALIAPELLTAMAGGQGSGLRMNEAEISRIIGGRSKWETLKATLNQWSFDPTQALSLTDEQRSQVRSLLGEVKKRTEDRLSKLTKARYDLVGASDVNGHRKIMADLHSELYSPTPEVTPEQQNSGLPPGVTVREVPKPKGTP